MELKKALTDLAERLGRHSEGVAFNIDDVLSSVEQVIAHVDGRLSQAMDESDKERSSMRVAVEEVRQGVAAVLDNLTSHIDQVHSARVMEHQSLGETVRETLAGLSASLGKLKDSVLNQTGAMPAVTTLPPANLGVLILAPDNQREAA